MGGNHNNKRVFAEPPPRKRSRREQEQVVVNDSDSGDSGDSDNGDVRNQVAPRWSKEDYVLESPVTPEQRQALVDDVDRLNNELKMARKALRQAKPRYVLSKEAKAIAHERRVAHLNKIREQKRQERQRMLDSVLEQVKSGNAGVRMPSRQSYANDDSDEE